MSFRLSSRAKSLEKSGTCVSVEAVFGLDFVEVDLEPVEVDLLLEEDRPEEARVVVAFGAVGPACQAVVQEAFSSTS